MSWESVIGLEVHIQLATASKIFSGAATTVGAEPNRQACAIDLGLPGVLPVINREVVRMAVLFGLAIDAHIAPRSVFARKHYFYPDLPKGYQISQYDKPIVAAGHLDIAVAQEQCKRIGITRAHLEEDAGKSLHGAFERGTGIDLNRAGTPLVECVSEPDLRSAAEAVAYAKKLHTLVRYLGICDGNMQEGSFRIDANVSLRRPGAAAFGTRTETKNLNSFRFLEKAIDYEIARQADVLESGGQVVQETRLFDPERGETRSMRSKEEAHDYRYFPEPDLLPVTVDAGFIARVSRSLPELPAAKAARFVREYGLSRADAEVLTAHRGVADYFAAVVGAGAAPRLAANWVQGELAAAANRDGLEIEAVPITAATLAGLLARITDDTISGKIAKEVFEALWRGEGGSADAVIAAKGLRQISDSAAIQGYVDAVIAEHPQQVGQYRAGKTKVIGFLVGRVMQASQGKANPAEVNRLLAARLQQD